jgi:hypothetical protein
MPVYGYPQTRPVIYCSLLALTPHRFRCAMDEDGATEDTPVDEDTCLGDSGSPVIIRLSSGEDVQVGRLFTFRSS